MKKLSLKRFRIGPAEAGIASVALLVAGFIGYQFSDIRSQSADTLANADQETVAEKEPEIEIKEEKPQEQVEVPAEEEVEEVKPVEESEDEVVVVGVSATAVQARDVISAQATLDSPATGTCTIRFTKTGYDQVEKKVTINDSTKCETTLSKTQDFGGVTGVWEFTVTFEGKKKVSGQSAVSSLTLN